jgi:type II secretory pathway component PulF
MPVFEYIATNASGEAVKGTLLSASIMAAAEDLARQGYQVQHVGVVEGAGDPIPADFRVEGRVSKAEGTEGQRDRGTEEDITQPRSYVQTDVMGPLFNRVPLSDLLFFFRQLSTMLKAGMGMVASLDTLSKQTHDSRLRSVMRELREHALAGRPISAGLQRYPEMFTPLMLSLVRVGEESGMLDSILAQIAGYIEREIELRNHIRRVTIYPKLVVGASIFIILVANMIIASVGGTQQIDSLLTRWTTWIVLGPIIVGLWLFFRVGLQNPRIKYTWDEILLTLPLFGKAVRQLCMAKFGRAFGVLYAGGVPVHRAVQLAADACGNEHLRARIHPAARGLQEGIGITEAFTATGAFEPIVLDMARTGETTGNVDFMLTKIAEFYEEEGKTRSHQFAVAFGVLAVLVVAIYVAYTVINFYVGYFSGAGRAAAEAAGWIMPF